MPKEFRIDAKHFFLTISQISPSLEEAREKQKIAFDRVKDYFKDNLEYFIVCVEEHKESEHGGYHLHLFISLYSNLRTRKQDFFDFIGDKHAHMEKARNPNKCISYCIKEDKFYMCHNIDPENYIKDSKNHRLCKNKGVFHEVAERIKNGATMEAINDEFPGVLLKNSRHIQEYNKLIKKIDNEKKTMEYIEKQFKEKPLNDFQNFILSIAESEPNNRIINWIYDKIGGRKDVGKTHLTTYLSIYKNAYVINGGKEQDIYYNYDYQPIVIFDLARDAPMVAFDSIYRVMENFKNGYFLSTKYEGGVKRFVPPHVFVFSNELPNTEKMSLDRWEIIDVDKISYVKGFNQVLDNECQQVSEKVLVQDNVEDIKDIVMIDDVKDLPQDFVENISNLHNLYLYGNLRKGDESYKVYTYLGNGVFYNRLTMIGYKVI